LIGYHSCKYNFGKNRLSSQDYSFNLLKKILKNGDKLVILMRSRALWEDAVPELKSYKIPILKSPQSAYISEGICPPGLFSDIISALRHE
jgi:hypothetical protein